VARGLGAERREVNTTFLAIVFLVFSGLVILAAISLIRGVYQAARMAAEEEFEPFVDFFPPEPVVRTPGIVALGISAIVWGAGHVGAGAVWSATGLFVPRVPESWMVAGYLCIAASLTGMGGVMLLRSHPYGRTLVSWGQFLGAVLTFFGLAIALMLPGMREAPSEIREATWSITLRLPADRVVSVSIGVPWVIAACLGLYLVLTVMIGTLAQHAGKPGADDRGA